MDLAIGEPPGQIQAIDSVFTSIRAAVIEMEVQVLWSLGYQLQRLINFPHKFMLMFLKTLKVDKELAQVAWNFANDAYLGVACCHYPPELLATACIFLAFKTSQAIMPRVPWWILAEWPLSTVEEVAKCIYEPLGLGKVSLMDCKQILRSLLSDKEYFYTSFEHMYRHADHQTSKEGLKQQRDNSRGRSQSSNEVDQKRHRKEDKRLIADHKGSRLHESRDRRHERKRKGRSTSESSRSLSSSRHRHKKRKGGHKEKSRKNDRSRERDHRRDKKSTRKRKTSRSSDKKHKRSRSNSSN